MDRIVGSKYKLGRKIGSGSFGEIYLGSTSIPSTLDSLLPWLDYLVRGYYLTGFVDFYLQRRTSTRTRSSP
jgi:hypothetical protein